MTKARDLNLLFAVKCMHLENELKIKKFYMYSSPSHDIQDFMLQIFKYLNIQNQI